MIRTVVKDELILRIPSKPADKSDAGIIRDLLDTSEANRKHCVGMAANMIGEHKTILTFMTSGRFEVMVNPEIVSRSAASFETEEGCLSLRGTRKAVRYPIITVEYLDKNFRKKKGIFRGMEAQIIQHEIDHFSGKII